MEFFSASSLGGEGGEGRPFPTHACISLQIKFDRFLTGQIRRKFRILNSFRLFTLKIFDRSTIYRGYVFFNFSFPAKPCSKSRLNGKQKQDQKTVTNCL